MSFLVGDVLQEVEKTMGAKIVPHPTVPSRYSVTLSWGTEEAENALTILLTMRIPDTSSPEEVASSILKKLQSRKNSLFAECRVRMRALAAD